jgi:hypothetical protein
MATLPADSETSISSPSKELSMRKKSLAPSLVGLSCPYTKHWTSAWAGPSEPADRSRAPS